MHTCRKLSGKSFDNFLSRLFGCLGGTVATNPFLFVLVPLLVTALLGTGFQRLVYESDPAWLFVPIGAPSQYERNLVENKFHLNSTRYAQGTETKLPTSLNIIIMPKHGGNIIDKELWIEAQKLCEAIENVTVPGEEGHHSYGWIDLCVRWEEKCIGNDFLELAVFMDKIKAGQMNLTFPLMTHPFTYKVYPLLANFGGVKIENGTLREAKAMKLSYVLRDDNGMSEVSDEWVEMVCHHLNNVDQENMKFTMDATSSKTIEFELNDNMSTMIDTVPLSILVMLAFSVYNCMSTDWVRSKPVMGLLGLALTLLSCIAGFGAVMYCGVPWQAINLVAIFLIIGIGMDDTFIMLAAWWRSEEVKGRDLVGRMIVTYTDAGVSITITSLTNILSFVIGASIPGFPCVQIFCIYTGSGLVFTYIWTITIFGGLLTWAAHAEHEDRHCLFFTKVLSKRESSGRSWWYRRLFSGGVGDPKDPNVKLTKDSKFMVFFRNTVAPILNKPIIKCFILLIFAIYLAISAYGVTMLNEGLQTKNLVRDDSYATNYFMKEDQYFRDYPYRIQAVITERLDYSNATIQHNVMNFVQKVKNSDYISDMEAMGQSWLEEYFDFIERNHEFLAYNISSKSDFNNHLFTFLQEIKGIPLSEDVCYNENGIAASRFLFQTGKIKNAQEDVKLLVELRRLASEAPFDVVFYHPAFPYMDQYSQIFGTTVSCILCCCITMTIVTLILIPNRVCVAWVAFTIVSIEIGVIGLMAMWDINLDVISMIQLVMGIGFSVDFSAHISYHYLAANRGKQTTPSQRLSDCLYSMGPPIVQGSITTLLGASGLLLHPSYLTRAFLKMLFLVIVLGVSHGLFLLPVLLTLFGPGSCSQQVKTTGQNVNNNNNNDESKPPIYRPRLQSPISVHNLLKSPTRKEFSVMPRTGNQWIGDQMSKSSLKKMTSQISFTEPADNPNESLVSHVSSCYSTHFMDRNNTRRMSMSTRGTAPVVSTFRPRAMSLIEENSQETSSETEVRCYSTTKNNNFTSIQYYINKHQTAFNSSALSRINHESGLDVDSPMQPEVDSQSDLSNPAVERTEFMENNFTGIDNPVFENEEESPQNTSSPYGSNEEISADSSKDGATIKHRKAALERLQAFEKDKMEPGFDI